MGFSASDVVPFTQTRSNLPELADQAKAGAKKIISKNDERYVALINADGLTTTTGWSASASTCC